MLNIYIYTKTENNNKQIKTLPKSMFQQQFKIKTGKEKILPTYYENLTCTQF